MNEKINPTLLKSTSDNCDTSVMMWRYLNDVLEVNAVLYFSRLLSLLETRIVHLLSNFPRSESSEVSFTIINDLSYKGCIHKSTLELS